MSALAALSGLAQGLGAGLDMRQKRKEKLADDARKDAYIAAIGQQQRPMGLPGRSPDEGSGWGGGALQPVPSGAAQDEFRATLLAGGLPPHAVEGILLNGRDESGFDPGAIGDNGNAFGILQWNGPRMRALHGFAAANGLDPASPKTQAMFTLHELQGPEKAAATALMATKTPGEAAAAFLNHFERPAETHRRRREAAYLGYVANPAPAAAPGPADQRATLRATYPALKNVSDDAISAALAANPGTVLRRGRGLPAINTPI